MKHMRACTDSSRVAFLLILTAVAAWNSTAAQHGPVLLVSNNAEKTVSFLDVATGRELAKVSTPKGPHEISVSQDGTLAYVADPGTGPGGEPGNSIVVLDLKTRTVKAVWEACLGLHDSRLSRDGKLLWVSCGPPKSILEMDTGTGKILRTFDTKFDGGWFVEVTPDEKKLFVPHLEGKALSVTTRATGASHAVYSGSTQFGVAISPDGREIWASDADEARLIVVDAKKETVIGFVDLPSRLATGSDGKREPVFSRLRFAPDGKTVVVVARTQLIVVDARRRTIEWKIGLPYAGKVPTISGDGRQAFVSHPGDNFVSVIDLAARRITGKFPTGKQPDGVAWVK